MADVSNLLNQYVNAGNAIFDPKQSDVAAAAYAKKEAFYNGGYASAATDDVGLTPADNVTNILNADPLTAVSSTAGRSSYVRDASRFRSVPRAAGDMATSAIEAAVLGVPQIANIGISAISPNAGAAVSHFIDYGRQNADTVKSYQLHGRQRAYGARNEVTGARNEGLRQEDLNNGDSDFIAGLKKVGRDTLDSMSNMDGAIVSDVVGSGIGSLATAGPMGRALSFLGKGAMPVSIGLQEAGGAHDQVMQQLLAEGYDAKTASKAALEAAALQFPAAAATGLLTSKFEASPLKVASVKSALGNVLKEGAEEGLQSATGQLAANKGIQDQANSNFDLTDGLGENIAAGIVGGVGSGAAVQAPGVVGRVAIETAKLPLKAGAAAVGALMNRGDRLLSEAERQQAGTTEARINEVSDAISAPESRVQIEQAVNDKFSDPVQREQAMSKVDTLLSRIGFAEDEANHPNPKIAEALQGSSNRFEAMNRVLNIANDPQADKQDKLEATSYLLGQLRDNNSVIYNDLTNAVEEVDDNDPVLPALRAFEDVRANIEAHPLIAKVIENAAKSAEALNDAEVIDENVSTPEGQQIVRNAISVAENNPEAVNPKLNTQILGHIKAGKVEATPEQKAALEVSTALHEAAQTKEAEAKKLNIKSASDLVSDMIRTDEDGGDFKSAATHMKEIVQAVSAGNVQLAKEKLQHLQDFAWHMQNKVAALNEHVATGDNRKENAVKYPVLLNGKRVSVPESQKGLWVNRFSEASVRTAQKIGLDSKAVTTVANVLATAYPQLGLKPLPQLALDERLNAPFEQVREQAKAERRGKAAPETKPAPVEAPATAEVEQPAVREDTAPTEQKRQSEPKDKVSESVESSPEDAQPAEKLQPEVGDDEKVQPTDVKSEQTSEPAEAEKSQKTAEIEQSEASPKSTEIGGDQAADADGPSDTGAKRTGLAGLFPSLVQNVDKGIRQHFLAAYRLPKIAKSRLIGVADLANKVREALGSADAFEEFAGTLKAKLTPEVISGYDELLGFIEPAAEFLHKRLEEHVLDKQFKSQGGKTGRELLTEGGAKTPLNTWKEFLALNIVENRDGHLFYNENLIQTALLAGLQWSLTNANPQRSLDMDEIATILGVNADEIPQDNDLIARFSEGVSLQEAVDGLTDTVLRYWGVSANPDVETKYTRGIAEAVAKEVLTALSEGNNNFLEEYEVEGVLTVDDKGDDYTPKFKRYRRTQAKEFKEVFEKIDEFPSAIEELAVVDPERKNYVGEPPKKVATHQLRGSDVELTAQQKQVIANEQKVKHYLNTTMVDFAAAIGRDALVALFGKPITEGMNVNYKKSIEGSNRTITAAFDHVMSLVAEVRNRAEAAGVDQSEMPIHFDHNFSKVGRLHMQGAHNPQSSKFTREVVLSTWTTMDLTDKSQRDLFALGLAQHWGVKVEQQSRADSVEAVNKLITGDLKAPIAVLKQWVQRNGSNRPLKLNAHDLEILRKGFGDKGPGALHAAFEYVRYDLASEEETKAFKTSLYVEADGKTDGPINALMHLASGEFTTGWMKLMGKGGLFIGSKIKTLADWIGQDKQDLYKTTSVALRDIQADFRRKWAKSATVRDQLEAVSIIMDEFLGKDVTINEHGDLEFDRGIAKNPLTVTIYGSGINGIANKITDAIIKEFYRRLSPDEGQPLDAKTTAAMRRLMAMVAVKDYGKLFIADVSKETKQERGKGLEMTLSRQQVKNVQENIRYLFADQLGKAIDSVVGEHVNHGKVAIRKAVQVQSIFAEAEFNRRIAAKMAEKAEKSPEWKKQDFLTANEIAAIRADMRKDFPLIETGTQNFAPGASERSNVEGVEFSRTLDGKMSTPARIFAPKDAGVSGIPTLVIGPGDGQMMQNYSVTPGRPDGLLVFDGLNLSLSDIEKGSQLVNQAVLDGWLQGNPLAAAQKSYEAFLAASTQMFLMDDKQIDDLKKALFSNRKEAAEAGPDEIRMAMIGLNHELTRLANENQARKNALARVNLAVDHMATAESPHVVEDQLALSGSEDQIIYKLNQFYDEELAKLEGRDPPLMAQRVSQPIPVTQSTGMRVISAQELAKRIDQIPGTPEQKRMLAETLRAVQGSNYQIYRGTAAEIKAFADRMGRQVVAGFERAAGFIDPANQSIYLIENSGSMIETLTHELIHAATVDKVLNFYDNPATLNDFEQGAIKRIDALMDEFMEIPLNELTQEQFEEFNHARTEIQSQLDAGNRGVAVNEFMAWVLGNKELAEKTKTVKVKSKLAQIADQLVAMIKKLVFGKREVASPGTDLFSNLEFNTHILMANPWSFNQRMAEVTLAHSRAFGNNDRLTELRDNFAHKIAKFIQNKPTRIGQTRAYVEAKRVMTQATDVADSFSTHGFPMSMQESSTFRMMLAAFMTEAYLNPNAMVRVQEHFLHVTKIMKVEDFMTNPDGNDPNDRAQAQAKFNLITGNYLVETDKMGRSTLAPAFLALSQVNDEFRAVLQKMETPKAEKHSGKSLNEILDNYAVDGLDALSKHFAGEGQKAANVEVALDALTDTLMESVEDQEMFLDQFVNPIGNAIDKANEWMVETMDSLANQGIDKLDAIEARTNNKYVKAVTTAGKTLLAMASEDRADEVALGLIETANRTKLFKPLHELLVEFVGRTKDNAAVYDMIKLVRSTVQQIRQQFREELPKQIAKQFSRELTDAEWTHLFKGLAKTDLAALRGSMSQGRLMTLLKDPSAVRAEIGRLEQHIESLQPQNWTKLQQKSRELAEYMNTGKVPTNLLRNATAITHLLGEVPQRQVTFNAQTVRAVDQLVTLYALDGLDTETKESLSNLADTEFDGVSFAVSYLVGQRIDEMNKAGSTAKAEMNHYKGHIPSEQAPGVSLIVAKDSEAQKLRLLGFTKVADYHGSGSEPGASKKSYFFAPLSGKAMFNQGILQNVRATAYGVDPMTGYSVGVMTAGRISDPHLVNRITRARGLERNTGEALMPIYDADGLVVAYERSVDPAQEARLDRNTDLSKALGMWRGRQAEELMASDINHRLVDTLFSKWEEEKGVQSDAYINVFGRAARQDKVLWDAVKLITPQTRDYIESKFGEGEFWVRKDMLNDALGYRSASIGDAWTGTTRIPPQTAKIAQKVAVGAMGMDAYKYMMTAEKFWQNFVQDARVTIVVKSVVVPVTNLISNVYQLAARGVPLKDILSKMPKKTAEIDAYVKGRVRQIDLEGQLRAAQGANDITKQRKLTAEIQSIKDAAKRLSVWPLIEAGEFASISDVGISQEEILLSEGRLNAYIEKLVDKLPEAVKTAGKYAVISKDTALFKGLQRAVEYGDFLAKAILYDDLTQRLKKDKAYALGRVTEEYVNYDRLPGRSRSYLEHMGLLWFWNFKIRSTKIALSTMRNNPLHLVLSSLAPSPDMIGSIGSPVTDNVVTMGVEGELGWSVGPGMGFNAYMLNPWMNLWN